MNRESEQNSNHYLYNMQYFDKRNRLIHNAIMEHFEMHKEQTEDLLLDLKKHGPAVFTDLPPEFETKTKTITEDELALIDELVGLNAYLENMVNQSDAPEVIKDRIRLQMTKYSGVKEKQLAINDLLQELRGD